MIKINLVTGSFYIAEKDMKLWDKLINECESIPAAIKTAETYGIIQFSTIKKRVGSVTCI